MRGFNFSNDPKDWLGMGVYYFVDGVMCPVEASERWASVFKSHRDPCVLESVFKFDFDYVLDLRDESDLKDFNKVREYFCSKLELDKGRKKAFDRKIVCDAILEYVGAQAVINREYISAVAPSPAERELALGMPSIPNCTIMAVRDKSKIEQTRVFR